MPAFLYELLQWLLNLLKSFAAKLRPPPAEALPLLPLMAPWPGKAHSEIDIIPEHRIDARNAALFLLPETTRRFSWTERPVPPWPTVRVIRMTNVSLEHSGNPREVTELRLKQLRVRPSSDTSESPTNMWFHLRRYAPRRWRIKDFIQFPADVKEIECSFVDINDKLVGTVLLNFWTTGMAEMEPNHKYRQEVETGSDDIQLTMTWVAAERSNQATLTERLSWFGGEFVDRFHRTDELSDLDAAVSAFTKASEPDITPEGPERQQLLARLQFARRIRSTKLSCLSNIEEAVTRCLKMVVMVPKGQPDLRRWIERLVKSLVDRSTRDGGLSDVSEALEESWRAEPSFPNKDDEKLVWVLDALADSFCNLHERTGNRSGLPQALSARRRMVRLTPGDHPAMPNRLLEFGLLSLECSRGTSDAPGTVTEVITTFERMIELTPPDDEDLPDRLAAMGQAYLQHYECAADLSSLTRATSTFRKVLQLAPNGAVAPHHAVVIGASFVRQFEQTGEQPVLEEAIGILRESARTIPDGQEELFGCLSTLGLALLRLYERTGDLLQIAEAIESQRRAVHFAGISHEIAAELLANLGVSTWTRFEATEDPSDLEDAISTIRSAVQLMPDGHTSLYAPLNSLGYGLIRQFQITGNPSDLEEAVSTLRKAVKTTPSDHFFQRGLLNNLGDALLCRFKAFGDSSDLAEAVIVHKRMVENPPDGYMGLPILFSTLASTLVAAFEVSNQHSNLTEAISWLQESVRLTPEGDASKPVRLNKLGDCLKRRFDVGGNAMDLEESISYFKVAANHRSGASHIRLKAATSWAQLLAQYHPDSPEVWPAFDTALGLMATVAGLEQTVRHRYTRLQSSSGLACMAAAVAFSQNRPDKALEWLEQGRCLVWSQLSTLRTTPFEELRLYDERLSKRIADVAKRLESAGTSRGMFTPSMPFEEKLSVEGAGHAHLKLAREWEDLLREARNIPGFENFLRPVPLSSILQGLPESGFVVVINVDTARCDAVALRAGRDMPIHIPLPSFSVDKANKYRDALNLNLRSLGLRVREGGELGVSDNDFEGRGIRRPGFARTKGGPVHNVLRGLWEEVVKPILDALGISKTDGSSGDIPPRIWWSPTGALSFLPLHAAGRYGLLDPESVLDYVVSSYTPTVTALTDRIERSTASTTGKLASGIFLTCQPNALPHSPIPKTIAEVRTINRMATEKGLRVCVCEGSEVTVDACLEHMQNFSCIHLACHGSQNVGDPLDSRFFFHDDSTLTLATILKSNLENADLAFLSACQTSTGQENLSDEAVHLAAGMLAAGYLRVVATMWSIGDEHAQQVATNFYEDLWKDIGDDQGATFDGTRSACALHQAVRQLKAKSDDSERALLTWIPFVHFGY